MWNDNNSLHFLSLSKTYFNFRLDERYYKSVGRDEIIVQEYRYQEITDCREAGASSTASQTT